MLNLNAKFCIDRVSLSLASVDIICPEKDFNSESFDDILEDSVKSHKALDTAALSRPEHYEEWLQR